MSEIPRWSYEHHPAGFDYLDGYTHAPVGEEYVTYTDHLAECDRRVAEAKQRGIHRAEQQYLPAIAQAAADGYQRAMLETLDFGPAYEAGQRDMLDKCIIEAVNNSGRGVAHIIAALRALLDGAQ